MLGRLLSIGLLVVAAPFAPAGAGGAFDPPVLPEVRRHLSDGWACLQSDPAMARAHAMAVLVSDDVAVEVVLDRIPASRRTACRVAVDGALEAWERVLGGGIRLHRAEDGRHSGIVVRFQPDVREKGQPVAGYVNWKRQAEDGEGGVTGDVQIRSVDLDGEPMPSRAMRNIVMHEVGHLLGLDDTDRPGEVMSPLDAGRPVTAPSDAEAAALRRLRSEATDLLRDAR